MKDNLSTTISLIEQALRSCGQDFATADVRGYLFAALREAGHVSKKRQRRAEPMQEMIKQGKSYHDKWWDQIEENVRKAAQQHTKPTKDENTED